MAGRCPIVDTWWQTETGDIMISPLPGVTTTKPGSATTPLPGISADVVDDEGDSVGSAKAATSCSRSRGPAMLRGIYGDDERYVETYWSRFPRDATSPATAPSATATATSGCSAGWTT